MSREHIPSKYIRTPEEPHAEIERTKKNRKSAEADERTLRNFPWHTYNSRLVHGILSYNEAFKRVTPEEYGNIKTYIEDLLEKKRGRAVGLDIGGIGSQIFEDFSEGFFAKTAGVTLRDTRGMYGVDKKGDEKRHHRVITGDILAPDTQGKVREWLRGEKVDVIFERMDGGLKLFPRDKKRRWINAAIHELYTILADGGVMYLQLVFYSASQNMYYEFASNKRILHWARQCALQSQGTLDVEWNGASLRLHKLAGAPDRLPDL